jgi:hypothetical protein
MTIALTYITNVYLESLGFFFLNIFFNNSI